MRDNEIEALLQGVDIVVEDSCYCDKQAQYDYNGGAPADEDIADWLKPQYKGGRINGIT